MGDVNFLALVLQSYGLVPPPVNPCDPKTLCGADADPTSDSCTEMISNCRGGKVEATCDQEALCGPKGANVPKDSKECKGEMAKCMDTLVAKQPPGVIKNDIQEWWYLRQNAAVLNETMTDRINHKVNLIQAILKRIPTWLIILAWCLAGLFFIIFFLPLLLIIARMISDPLVRFKLFMLFIFGIITIVIYFLMLKLEIL